MLIKTNEMEHRFPFQCVFLRFSAKRKSVHFSTFCNFIIIFITLFTLTRRTEMVSPFLIFKSAKTHFSDFDARARHSGSLHTPLLPLTGAPGQPHSSDLLAASRLREDAGGGRLQQLPSAAVCAGLLRRPSSAASCGGRLRRPPVAAACVGHLRRPPAAAARGGRLCF